MPLKLSQMIRPMETDSAICAAAGLPLLTSSSNPHTWNWQQKTYPTILVKKSGVPVAAT
jgi:hypothetical protein